MNNREPRPAPGAARRIVDRLVERLARPVPAWKMVLMQVAVFTSVLLLRRFFGRY